MTTTTKETCLHWLEDSFARTTDRAADLQAFTDDEFYPATTGEGGADILLLLLNSRTLALTSAASSLSRPLTTWSKMSAAWRGTSWKLCARISRRPSLNTTSFL
ncbi:hypothetical protein BJX62DRAFT_192392 [Aspergillus germanicus]